HGSLALAGLGAGAALCAFSILANDYYASALSSPEASSGDRERGKEGNGEGEGEDQADTAHYAVFYHFVFTIGAMLGMTLFQAGLKSQLITRTNPIFKQQKSTFLSSIDVGAIDIAVLEKVVTSIKMLATADDIFAAMHESFRILFVLPIPFIGAAFILTLLQKL
ncbi:hypothetical protein EV182_006249, partial [Spiromyces aspiralis]